MLLMVGNQKTTFIFREAIDFHRSGFSNTNTETCFPELRSGMNPQYAERWRRAKGPNRISVKTQEEGSSPRMVSGH